jgi:hypothetical protein
VTVYLVSYDLVNESRSVESYEPLWDEMKRLGAHRTNYSLWLVNLTNTAEQVLAHLRQFVDKDDRIWVAQLTSLHTYCNAIAGTNAWLKGNPLDR